MKPISIWRYLILPALVFYAGTKIGVKYAKSVYVSKDRKFIEGKVVDRSETNGKT